MYDVAVVGLGPAGSTVAYALASKGYKVLALDKEKFPRYKSCGGCISIKVERMLDFDISGVIEETVYGTTFTYRSSRPLDILSDRPVAYNVMRDRFDTMLVERAREAGAEIVEGCRVKGLSDDGDAVTVSCEGGDTHRAKFLVGADGASGFTGRDYFGLDPREAAVSITSEVPYDRGSRGWTTGKLFIDFGSVPFGYGWIFPKKECLSVGIAGDASLVRGKIKDLFYSFVSSHDVLRGLKVGPRVGWMVPVFYDTSKSMVKGRVLLAGDTGHLVDPFLGEGIYYAILTADAAAEAVAGCLESGTSDLSGYQDWLEKEVYPEFKAADQISELVYKHQRLWYRILEKEPHIMQRFYDVIRGEESNRSFYGWVYAKVRSKPWKVIRRWVESKRLPA